MDNQDQLVIRTAPLTPEEKKLLTNSLERLKLVGKLTGQITIHFNQGNITSIQPMPIIR